MKRFASSVLLAVFVVAGLSSSPAEADSWRKIPFTPANTVVTPVISQGEAVRFELEEWFPNLCFRPAPVEHQVDLESRRVLLADYAFVRESGFCPMLLAPSQRTIELGELPPGRWELWISDHRGSLEKSAEFEVR